MRTCVQYRDRFAGKLDNAFLRLWLGTYRFIAQRWRKQYRSKLGEEKGRGASFNCGLGEGSKLAGARKRTHLGKRPNPPTSANTERAQTPFNKTVFVLLERYKVPAASGQMFKADIKHPQRDGTCIPGFFTRCHRHSYH